MLKSLRFLVAIVFFLSLSFLGSEALWAEPFTRATPTTHLVTQPLWLQKSSVKVNTTVPAPGNTTLRNVGVSGEDKDAMAVDSIVSDDCASMETYLDEDLAVVKAGNPLMVNACALHNQWLQLWNKGNCSLASQKNYQVLDCEAQKTEKCTSIKASHKVNFEILAKAVYMCEPAGFFAACEVVNSNVTESAALKCDSALYALPDCEENGFKKALHVSPAYVNNPEKIAACLKQNGLD